MKEQKMTDEQLLQELNKSKGGRIGGKLLSLLGGAVTVSYTHLAAGDWWRNCKFNPFRKYIWYGRGHCDGKSISRG